MQERKTVLSLFCSAGIGELGIKKLGMDILVSNELMQNRCDLYRVNYPDTINICGDIWEQQDSIVESWRQKSSSSPFLIYATPPCQGMSSNGIGTILKNIKKEKLPLLDPRNRLIIPTMHIVQKLQPEWLLLENVVAMKDTVIQDETGSFTNIIDYIRRILGNGYYGGTHVVNCADYGIPQIRKRLITIFTKNKNGIEYFKKYQTFMPPRTHSKQADSNLKPWISLKDAIGNLPTLDAKIGLNARIDYHPWHFVSVMQEEKYYWLSHTPQGQTAYDNQCINQNCRYSKNKIHGSLKSLGVHSSCKDTPLYCEKCLSLLPRPNIVDPVTKKRRLIKGYNTAYKRMSWNEPCPTITQNFIFEASDQKVHPTQTRVLSFYEAMIVQSISDYSFSFSNSRGKQISKSLCAQVIGESVPPKLIEIICNNILKIDSNLF